MKSHGDSGLVPTSWGKTVTIEWTPPTHRMELKTTTSQNNARIALLVHTSRAPRRVKTSLFLIYIICSIRFKQF